MSHDPYKTQKVHSLTVSIFRWEVNQSHKGTMWQDPHSCPGLWSQSLCFSPHGRQPRCVTVASRVTVCSQTFPRYVLFSPLLAAQRSLMSPVRASVEQLFCYWEISWASAKLGRAGVSHIPSVRAHTLQTSCVLIAVPSRGAHYPCYIGEEAKTDEDRA